MNRRRFLASTATIGLTGVAGCSNSQDTAATPEDTQTTTSTPTATTTEEQTKTTSTTTAPEPPEILEAGLISYREDIGDVAENQVNAVGQGAWAKIGYRYETDVHDGKVNTTQQVKVFDSSGKRVGLKTGSNEQLVDQEGRSTWENALWFDTTNWDLGDYEFEVLIRDNVVDEVSETATGTFTVNSPLGPQEATLQSVDAPDAVAKGEDYSFTLNFKNTSTRDGSVVTPLSAKYESGNSWTTYEDTNITATMAAGETASWESGTVSFDYTGEVQYRLDAIDAIWTVTVTE